MARTFMVIGGSAGIGESIVHRLHDSGAKVIVQSRRVASSETAETITHPLDIMDEKPDFYSFDEPLAGLVYAPGSIRLKPFRGLKEADFLDDWKLNFLGAVKATQFYLSALQRSEQASLVFFSSVAAKTGLPFHASIASAKGAIEGLTRSLAAELTPKIRVNTIALSLTDTPLAASLLNSEAKQTASVERHPLKRIGTADEVASLACWLLSEQSAFVTGQVISMDGGLSSIR
jgi:NAD(P)-dependent dehydrogenase (short-subunit alcohol dehydrogenase family)